MSEAHRSRCHLIAFIIMRVKLRGLHAGCCRGRPRLWFRANWTARLALGEHLIWRCNASNCLSLETSTTVYCVSSYHHRGINNARLLLQYALLCLFSHCLIVNRTKAVHLALLGFSWTQFGMTHGMNLSLMFDLSRAQYKCSFRASLQTIHRMIIADFSSFDIFWKRTVIVTVCWCRLYAAGSLFDWFLIAVGTCAPCADLEQIECF